MRSIAIRLLGRKIIPASLAFLLSLNACTDNFTEINTNKSTMMAVGPKQLVGLFTRAQMSGASWLSTDNYSRMSSTMANHLSGYISCGFNIYDQNQINEGWQNTIFNIIYSNAFPPVKSIMEVSRDGVNVAAYNVALIWKVFLMHRMTDIWGPVPYTDAGNGQETVAYQSQKEVYYLMLEDLANATNALAGEVAKTPGLNVFGVGDMIYNGDVAKWIKFGNTLRLRLAIRISNIDPAKAQAEAEAAIKGAMMETNADDALMTVAKWGSGGNGMPRMESFYQDVMSTTMESYLVGYKDPRLQEYFSPVAHDASMDVAGYPEEYKANVGNYAGFTSGVPTAEYSYLRAHSKYGPRFKDGNQLVTPINIMHSAETFFLKAEGAWRGWNMGGTAEDFYKRGIEVSITQWRGTAIASDSIQKYVNSGLTPIAPNNHPYYDPPVSDVPVKFSSNRDKQFEQIMLQKWIAIFPISVEAWAEYRRTRLPKIYAKKYTINGNVDPAKGQIITRALFTSGEKNSQPNEIAKAIQLLGGADIETTPLWWDIHTN